VIVDVDERSLSAVGQWPWRRDLVGNLVARIRDLGASAVALDVVFAESDRYAGSGAATDQAMADALRPGGVVLGYAFTFDNTSKSSSACGQHPLGLAVVRRDDERAPDPFFQATGLVCSLPVLTQAARRLRISKCRPGPRRPAPACAAAGDVRRSRVSLARARVGHRGGFTT
jgi:adenylate cyclase